MKIAVLRGAAFLAMGAALVGCATTCPVRPGMAAGPDMPGAGPHAGPRGGEGPRQGGPERPHDPALAEAFKACAAEQGVQLPEPADAAKPGDQAGPMRPELAKLDHDKLGACLAGKGIERPHGPPPGMGPEGGPGPEGRGLGGPRFEGPGPGGPGLEGPDFAGPRLDGPRHGPGGPGLPPPPRDPAFAEAFKACAAEQGVKLPEPGAAAAQEQGKARPRLPELDRDKLDTCLVGKGIDSPQGPPSGPGPDQGGPSHGPRGPGLPPPPRDPAFAQAFKACAAEQGVQLPEPGAKPGLAPGQAKQAMPPAPPKFDHDKLDVCLAGKGFQHPPRPGKAPAPAASKS